MRPFNRRDFLQHAPLAGAGAMISARYAFAGAPGDAPGSARFVCVILRGALDGLSAVPPCGDPDYARLRREIAIGSPGSAGGALPLDGTFGLNPGLAFLHDRYQAKELVVFHAVASPYRERSHFDGQNALENGTPVANGAQSGWLNRALIALPAAARRSRESGVALGQNVPLVMRGSAPVASWSPSVLPSLDDDTLQRIADRYASDPLLSQRFAAALATDAIADAAQADAAQAGAGMTEAGAAASDGGNPPMAAAKAAAAGSANRGAAYTETVRTAAGFLKRGDGPTVAVFDTTGWDTHANEGNGQGQLAARLHALDEGLKTLKEQLGPVWQHTAVLVITEFGRTAAANGTRGTDHGTGAAAFLVGGAVAGGRVIADWPGLSARSLYQGRDLNPTLDLRAVTKGVLADHLAVPRTALDADVFPQSTSVKPLTGLIRA